MSEKQDLYLSDGFKLPQIGFGTSGLSGAKGTRLIESALDMGYRLVDTAFNYENEGAVGAAIRNTHVPRTEITVTSKLPGRHHRYQEAIDTIQESVYRSGLDYIDLYLIHWPNPREDLYVEAWQALIDAQRWGWIRSIGVCNFLPEHIERIEKETGVLPVVNQIELHPFFNQAEQKKFNSSKGIITEAWSPLTRAQDISDSSAIGMIAKKHQKSIAQIILRWHIQLGVLPIPKSTQLRRQKENLAIFDFNLTDEEMTLINSLTEIDGRITNQDPAVHQEF